MSEFTTVNLGIAIKIAKEKKRKDSVPPWKRFYDKHHEEELARRREYRKQHKEEIAEYNRRYRKARRKKQAIYTDPIRVLLEEAVCSA